jgi:hypothetical protein
MAGSPALAIMLPMTDTAASPSLATSRRFLLLPETSAGASGQRARVRRYRLTAVGAPRRVASFGPAQRDHHDFAHLKHSYD